MSAAKSFDLHVHKRDPKTGKVIRENNYVLHIVDKVSIFERDGIQYFPNGERVHQPQLVEAVSSPALEAPKKPKGQEK